jgi:UDP-N-acetylglucosamine 2-epimerase
MAVVQTGQHRTMLDHALQFFKIKPDFDLDVMRPNQTLNSLAGRLLDTVENACHRFEPNMVLIQGDTTTAFALGTNWGLNLVGDYYHSPFYLRGGTSIGFCREF